MTIKTYFMFVLFVSVFSNYSYSQDSINKPRIKFSIFLFSSYTSNGFERIKLKEEPLLTGQKIIFNGGYGHLFQIGFKAVFMKQINVGVSFLYSNGSYSKTILEKNSPPLSFSACNVKNLGVLLTVGEEIKFKRFFLIIESGIDFSSSTIYDRVNTFVYTGPGTHGSGGGWEIYYQTSKNFIDLYNSIGFGYNISSRLRISLKSNFLINLNKATIEFDDKNDQDRHYYNYYWWGGGAEMGIKLNK